MTSRAPGDLHVLSAGAAQGLVLALAPRFLADTGVALRPTFGAVGAIREKLFAGQPCDALILTAAMIDELAESGHVNAATRRNLGHVQTGIAVRARDALPNIASREALRQSLRAATDIFLPDPQRATAGIHFARILEQLGIHADMAARLRPYPNGAAAMHALAHCGGRGPIGCTQITEIKFTDGVTLVGPLPKEFELSTVYSIAVCSGTTQPAIALRLAELLCGAASAGVREQAGFEAR